MDARQRPDTLSLANRGKFMATGKKAASEASKELKSKGSTQAEKSVAASDLSQAKKKASKKK